MPLLQLCGLSSGSRAIDADVLRGPPKDMGRELMAMSDCWHGAKTLFYEASAVRHALSKIADQIKRGICWEVPPLPEAHYLIPVPFLYLQKAYLRPPIGEITTS